MNVSRDIIPQSVVQRVKSPYPAIQNAAYDKILRTRFTAMLDDLVPAVAPLLSVDRSRACSVRPTTLSARA